VLESRQLYAICNDRVAEAARQVEMEQKVGRDYIYVISGGKFKKEQTSENSTCIQKETVLIANSVRRHG